MTALHGGHISDVTFWVLFALFLAALAGATLGALNALFDRRDRPRVEQDLRERRRLGAVIVMSDRRL